MINKSKEFFENIEKTLKDQGFDTQILEDYHGRFFEYAQAALATDAPAPIVHYLIGEELKKQGASISDIINELENLSHDDWGKDMKLYY
jgi:hypothetical protein